MKKKFKVLLEIGGAVAAVPLLIGGISYGIIKVSDNIKTSNVEKYKQIYGDTYDYYHKTDGGVPLTLPIKDNMISVVLDSFSDEAKENARYAISKLDDVLKTQEFTIYDNGEMPNHKNYIHVKIVDDVDYKTSDGKFTGIGEAEIKFDQKTGKIKYPVEISIEKKYVDWYNYVPGKSDSPKTSVFSTILQHELGHAFGLCDRYLRSDIGDTIMYAVQSDKAQDYTKTDYHNLRYVYDKEYDVEVKLPNKMQVTLYTQENQFINPEESEREM